MGHIFISYSHTDAKYVMQLAKKLQSEGFGVWVDERLDYGSRWPHEIQTQLDSCEAFIVVMTPRSFTSDWVQSELSRADRKNKPLFPLLLEGDEPWLSVENLQYVDVRGGSMPPEKFYGRLEQVTPRNKTSDSQPDNGPIQVGEFPKTRPPSDRVASAWNYKYILGLLAAVIVLATIGIVITQASKKEAVTSLPASATPEVVLLPASTSTATLAPSTVVPTETLTTTPAPTDPPTPTAAEMIFIPPGEFVMGNDKGSIDEKPAHKVNLKAFLIDKYEVTNRQYAECVRAGQCQPPQKLASFTQEHYFDNPLFENYPVIYVNWSMAQNFCAWRGARLPTEAEWEKAARGKGDTLFPWGDKFECSRGNFDDETQFDAFVVEGGPNCDGFVEAAPVGSFPSGASSYGVEDLAGNVWEWVSDWYAENYYKNSSRNDPTGPAGGQFHVLRGGSWSLEPDAVRTTNRFFFGDNNINPVFVGFRCAKDAP
jgi:formylglycine-generating enzyme required for sulfatase activity